MHFTVDFRVVHLLYNLPYLEHGEQQIHKYQKPTANPHHLDLTKCGTACYRICCTKKSTVHVAVVEFELSGY